MDMPRMSNKSLTLFIYMKTITIKGKHSYISTHFSEPHQNLTCKMCKTKKLILFCRLKSFRCRLYVLLHRY